MNKSIPSLQILRSKQAFRIFSFSRLTEFEYKFVKIC